MTLKNENYFLRDIKTIFLQLPETAKSFQWRYIENESHQPYLGDKKQKTMFKKFLHRGVLLSCMPTFCIPEKKVGA